MEARLLALEEEGPPPNPVTQGGSLPSYRELVIPDVAALEKVISSSGVGTDPQRAARIPVLDRPDQETRALEVRTWEKPGRGHQQKSRLCRNQGIEPDNWEYPIL